jgi:hypothetical protein
VGAQIIDHDNALHLQLSAKNAFDKICDERNDQRNRVGMRSSFPWNR